MCGITGIILKSPEPRIAEYIETFNNRLKHRGPDDEGYLIVSNQTINPLSGNDTISSLENQSISYCSKGSVHEFHSSGHLALGHRRLSVLDLSFFGHQPMCSPDKAIWIVYNGEIYNHQEIKKELSAKGYQFCSTSDTEVILASYREWGQECIHRFNGMWSFVIYDSHLNVLFGSRDPLGVKPLYYYFDESRFLFASEQKAFVGVPFLSLQLNDRAVFDFLVLGHSNPEPEGFYKNIMELKAGQNFTFQINQHQLSIKPYFSFQTHPIHLLSCNYDELVEKLRSVLENSIRLHTIADVEIGACLSGGIDSSIIVMMLHQQLKRTGIKNPLKVFTASYPGNTLDESRWAREVVNASESQWFQTFPDEVGFLQDMQDLLYYADSPMLTTSTYAQYKVMQLASQQGVKVLLDGQGADELFAGYDYFDAIYWNELITKLKVLSLLNEMRHTSAPLKALKKWIQIDLKQLALSVPATLVRKLYDNAVWEMKFIHPEFKNKFLHRYGEVYYPYGNNLNTVLKGYAGGEKLQEMLRLEDRMSMRFSIESRTPFADDRELIDMAFMIPSAYKIKNGIQKHILRDAAKDILPTTIYARKDKIGFQTPEYHWLRAIHLQLGDQITSNIDPYVNSTAVKNEMARMVENPTSKHNSKLLRFVIFSRWRDAVGM
jgi:asparagine synthase (glutamine-hydrolysing)